MKAIVYSSTGGIDVLRFVDRPVPEPGPGEVRVRVAVSGVNHSDWKGREFGHRNGTLMFPEVIPHNDGSGVIDAVGAGVDRERIGQRVWVWEAAYKRPHGTAAEYSVVPSRQAVPLPSNVSFEAGACLGLPAVAAHRCLLTGQKGPDRLGPGTLTGRTVLVAGGAGAVGHAAIQLGAWSGATVIATVSSEEKAKLARVAGAAHTVDYRSDTAEADIRAVAPDGVDLIVEVAATKNIDTAVEVLAPNGTIAAYGTEGDSVLAFPTKKVIGRNTRLQFVLVMTLPAAAKDLASADITRAAAAGALAVGEEAGLPIHRFPHPNTGEAQDAVQGGTLGKVVVEIGSLAG
ncbi:NADPH:quinone reductase [Amycolatopsis sp. WAC 01376]|uniref:NADPH:quinone reductase n=1 Tax=Amycolatopsis sp. WAC 01376 TaxID=2203195 RepID=UPI000F79F995|nr:NADPH:quinone reductase [Amycolatopsis sp. WAC 01376]RSM66008.1 NADPH:quinone reductase [Amycolatopsis sp. WAC 01376]